MMNASRPTSLSPAVSSALAGWLALSPDERDGLARAVAALSALDAAHDAHAATVPSTSVSNILDRVLTIDAVPGVDSDLFGSAAYRALGKGETLSVYVAGCRGLFELSQQVGFGSYKLGWSRGRLAETRLASLRAEAYAACWQDSGRMVEEAGYDNWEATVLPLSAERHADSPVRSKGRSLLITLPAGVDPVGFDRDLMAALAPRSLSGFAASEDGAAHCAALGIDPAKLRRFTAQSGRRRRTRTHDAATEIFRFAPRQEVDLLARLIEAVVARAAAPLMRR